MDFISSPANFFCLDFNTDIVISLTLMLVMLLVFKRALKQCLKFLAFIFHLLRASKKTRVVSFVT